VHVVCRYLEAHAEREWEEDEDEKQGQAHQQVMDKIFPTHPFCNLFESFNEH
jgi:hypothetical protein